MATASPPVIALMPAPFLLARENHQREAHHAGALPGGLQRVDGGGRGVVFFGQQSGYRGHDAFNNTVRLVLRNLLSVIAVCQHGDAANLLI